MGLHHQAIVGNSGDGCQHLQRGDGDALAEAVGQQLTVAVVLVAGHIHRSRRFALQINAGGAAHAKIAQLAVKRHRPHLQADRRGPDIQRLYQNAGHIDHAMRLPVPVFHPDAPGFQKTLIDIGIKGGDHAQIERGGNRQHFHDRPRLVLFANGGIRQQRGVGHIKIGVRVKTGIIRHRQNFAVARVHHQDGALGGPRFADRPLQFAFCQKLHITINRQHNIRPMILALICWHDEGNRADLLVAFAPGQVILIKALDSVIAHQVAADKADHMRGQRALGVAAARHRFDIDGDRVHLSHLMPYLRADTRGQQHPGLAAGEFLEGFQFVNADNARQFRRHLARVGDENRADADAIFQGVHRQRLHIAVVDVAACRRQPQGATVI